MRWQIQSSTKIKSTKELRTLLLSNRQIVNEDQFFHQDNIDQLSDIDLGINKQFLKKVAQRIKLAISRQEKVIIYGDYDVDGICATSILWLTLKNLGLETVPFIPDRMQHGYGLSIKALEELIPVHKPSLLITVDNGIVAHSEIEWLKDHRVEVIVTDHHQPSEKLPKTPFLLYSTIISGAAVAWTLARALDRVFSSSLIDLVALSTISDQMCLTDVNRVLVKAGLKELARAYRPGIRALLEASQIEPQNVSVQVIGYGLAPKINAAGRISQGMTALRLLCTANSASAKRIAQKLNTLNQERQDLTLLQLQEAQRQAQNQQEDKLLFISSSTFHEGIIGLLAGKLTEKYSKPSIVVASDGEIAKASARSVAGVDITELIRKVQSQLLSVGGHQLAAGFSAYTSQLPQIRQDLQQLASLHISQEVLTARLLVDAEIKSDLISPALIELQREFEPYGLGNSQPRYVLRNVVAYSAQTVGANQQHLKLALQIPDRVGIIKAMGWQMGNLLSQIDQAKKLDIAFELEENHWRDHTQIQLIIKDFRQAESLSF